MIYCKSPSLSNVMDLNLASLKTFHNLLYVQIYTTNIFSTQYNLLSKFVGQTGLTIWSVDKLVHRWIGCHVRPNKQRNWSGDQLLHKAKASASLKKRSFANLLRAHNLTTLILSYKRSHGDHHRRLVIMQTGGARTIEATSMVKIQSSKIVNQSYAPAAYGDRFWFTIVCYISIKWCLRGLAPPLSLVINLV